jgi:predicted ester cyclase
MSLPRDSAYKPAVEAVFERFPALGLAVHELVTNGDRLAMRFSEHAATPEGAMACWAGIGLYAWNRAKLTECRVEQDFWSQRRQLAAGAPDPLEPPHPDPWLTTRARPPDSAAEAVVRAWLAAGDLRAVAGGRVDEGSPADHVPVVDVDHVDVLDLFSAGSRVAFHASMVGSYRGGLDGIEVLGQPAAIVVAGIAAVEGGQVTDLYAVTDRFGTSLALARTVTAEA